MSCHQMLFVQKEDSEMGNLCKKKCW